MRTRSQTATAGIDFIATDRQTKRLVEFIDVDYSVAAGPESAKPGEPRKLIGGLTFPITAGMRVGLVGPNGSGKTTLLRLLRGEIVPESGEIKKANLLRTVYFDQNRVLDGNQTLRRALAPDSDAVVYQDRVIHVASWASRFLFTGEQLNQPVERLSGGERARVLIANLMLQPADLLLLDEPTNDLDIPTLEILEESLLEYPGALMLVTHDRFMLDRVSTIVLGLDGLGNVERFADYQQWEEWQIDQLRKGSGEATGAPLSKPASSSSAPASKKKLSYLEAREFSSIEEKVEAAEEVLQARREEVEDPVVATDAERLQGALAALDEAQDAVDILYARWAELEAKRA
jgi:ABC transport system ATP-binding/permease protein